MSVRPPPQLVLASTSRYRQALLQRLSIPFTVYAPGCDEDIYPDLSPDALALQLARDKAGAVDVPNALVIGSDQVVDLDGAVLGKPHTAAAACDQLGRLAGRAHRLVTAVAVRDTETDVVTTAVDVHTMHMRALTSAQIANYVACDQPLDCAGSYILERRGVALFDRIDADPETADDTAIIGLPMTKLLRLLRGFGLDVLSLPHVP